MKYKLILSAIVLMLFCVGIVRADNPTLDDTARGTLKLGARLGVNTNGATTGQVLTFNGSQVVWGAGGGGGGFDTNADWIVNGTWKFTNAVKFPGHIFDDTDKESISSQQRILFDVNEIESLEWWLRITERSNASVSLDWENSLWKDDQNVIAGNYQSRFLAGSDGNSVYNWQSGDTFDGAQNRIMNLKQGNIWDASNVPVLDSPNRRLIAADGGYFASFGTYTLNDNNSNPSLNSNTRTLRNSSNLNVLDWENLAIGTQGGTWIINGLSSANLLTNLVTSSAPFISITGTGGHTYTITGVGTVVTNNASPTFAALTATTYNSLLPATFITNITSAGMTVTQQGTHTINIEPILSSVAVTNITGDGIGITVTGSGTRNYNIAGNYTVIVTNNSSPTFGTTVVNGKILSTATTAITTPIAQIHAVNTNQLSTEVSFLADNYGVTNIPSFVGRRARGTAASPTAVQTDDVLSAFTGRGYGTTAFSALSKGSIAIHAAENWSDSAQGTYVRILTTPTGSTTAAERVRVDQAGNVGIGTTPTVPLDVVGAGNFTGTITSGGLTVNGNSTLGQNSGSTIAFVGNTATIANGLNFGSGQWNIPSVGVITNTGAGIFALNTITASNFVSPTSIAGTTTWDSGTNNIGQIKVNNGAGTLQTFAMYTVSTNTPAGINPTVNTINTNGSQVAFVEIACAFGANSRAYLWTSTALSPKCRIATSVASTNSIIGWVQPNATWAVSNDLGTVTAIAGEGQVETH